MNKNRIKKNKENKKLLKKSNKRRKNKKSNEKNIKSNSPLKYKYIQKNKKIKYIKKCKSKNKKKPLFKLIDLHEYLNKIIFNRKLSKFKKLYFNKKNSTNSSLNFNNNNNNNKINLNKYNNSPFQTKFKFNKKNSLFYKINKNNKKITKNINKKPSFLSLIPKLKFIDDKEKINFKNKIKEFIKIKQINTKEQYKGFLDALIFENIDFNPKFIKVLFKESIEIK